MSRVRRLMQGGTAHTCVRCRMPVLRNNDTHGGFQFELDDSIATFTLSAQHQ